VIWVELPTLSRVYAMLRITASFDFFVATLVT